MGLIEFFYLASGDFVLRLNCRDLPTAKGNVMGENVKVRIRYMNRSTRMPLALLLVHIGKRVAVDG